jgi:hypothetical protein
MPNLTSVIRQLKKERESLQAKAEQLDAALKALGSLGSLSRGFRRVQAEAKKQRTMPAAARKRIAAAQRARWAKWRSAGRKK